MSCPPPKVNPPVVIDNGSFTIKAGYAGDQSPRLTVPTVIGKTEDGKVLVGDQCKDKPNLEYPIQRGVIKNWDGMIEIWRYILKELNADLSKNPILLTEPACVSKEDREKMTQIMFETFNASSVYLANQPILSLYACGRKDGFVISSGHGVTQLVPSHEGNLVPSANVRIDMGGCDLWSHLIDLLKDHHRIQVSCEEARIIKESHCYVAKDKGVTPEDKILKLSDGKEITLNHVRTATTELFMTPSFFETVNAAIIKSSQETGGSLKSLYSGIVISGGNTLFEGMAERLQKEMQALAGPGVTVKVSAGLGGVNTAFIGGSILTCLDAFPPLCITRKDYEENGSAIVHTKCL